MSSPATDADKEELWQTYFDAPPSRLLFSDDDVVAFEDRSPRAAKHILVVPRHRHIRGVEALRPTDRPLLEKMARVGSELTNCDAAGMGFHQWPTRSVAHLHLHCLCPPFLPAWQKIRYTPLFSEKNPIGFVSLTSVLRRLSRQN